MHAYLQICTPTNTDAYDTCGDIHACLYTYRHGCTNAHSHTHTRTQLSILSHIHVKVKVNFSFEQATTSSAQNLNNALL